MDVYHLRSFVVLAEHRHFGRAAKALHLSQPALTKQIRRLEDDVGSALFERTHGATRLSAVGERWLPEVQELLARFDRVVALARATAKGAAGRLRVGFGFHTLELVPSIVAQLRAVRPEVQVMLRDLSTAEQAAALQAREIDVGFMRMPLADKAGYEVLRVIDDRLVLVAPAERKPPGKGRLEDWRDEAFVSISRVRSPGFFNHVLEVCAAHGFHPRIVQEVHEFPTAIALVRAGMGVTVIPASLGTEGAAGAAGVRRHAIKDRRAAWEVGAVWRKGDTNPVLAEFVGLLRKAI